MAERQRPEEVAQDDAVSDTVSARVRTLIAKFLGDRGTTRPELRTAVLARAHAVGSGSAALERAGALGSGESRPLAVPDDLVAWVDTVATDAPAASDADVARLMAAGYSEDDIIEVTEAAALGASLARLEIAHRVIGDVR